MPANFIFNFTPSHIYTTLTTSTTITGTLAILVKLEGAFVKVFYILCRLRKIPANVRYLFPNQAFGL